MSQASQLPSGQRKYRPIWDKIKADRRCEISCPHRDTHTIIQGVAREKLKDKKKEKGFLLKNEITDTGIIFSLVLDTSINNL